MKQILEILDQPVTFIKDYGEGNDRYKLKIKSNRQIENKTSKISEWGLSDKPSDNVKLNDASMISLIVSSRNSLPLP